MEVRQANDFEKRNYSPVRTRKCALLCYADLQKLNASLLQYSCLSVVCPIFSEDIDNLCYSMDLREREFGHHPFKIATKATMALRIEVQSEIRKGLDRVCTMPDNIASTNPKGFVEQVPQEVSQHPTL